MTIPDNQKSLNMIVWLLFWREPGVTVVEAKYEPVIGGVIAGLDTLFGCVDKDHQRNIDITANKFGLIRSKSRSSIATLYISGTVNG